MQVFDLRTLLNHPSIANHLTSDRYLQNVTYPWHTHISILRGHLVGYSYKQKYSAVYKLRSNVIKPVFCRSLTFFNCGHIKCYHAVVLHLVTN